MSHTKEIIFTIGHSTLSIDEFIALLKEHNIQEVVDIRTVPKSRHNPQFNHEALSASLHNHHIGYCHIKDLGGFRKVQPHSINIAWRNASFRGFADYMQTDQFTQTLNLLIEKAAKKRTVIMCAEAVPWHCHRSLIADALLVHGYDVQEIIGHTTRAHSLTPWARVHNKQIIYDKKVKNE
jgi:uncharacterized protein (DUF488 family)